MDTEQIKIWAIRALRGPNLYAYMPVLHVVLDIGDYEGRASNQFHGFGERLVERLPGLKQHECTYGQPGGFVERLNSGTNIAHICEHVTLELQSIMGFDVSFGRAENSGERGIYNVVIAYEEEEPAREALATGIRLMLAALHNTAFDLAAEIERLQELADEYRLGPSTAAIVRAARARHIPVIRLEPTGSLVQLGYGIHQERIRASTTSDTSAIAVESCQEKPLTNRLLSTVGVPVPEGHSASSPDEAWESAQTIGLPVVAKPEDGNQGKGVSVNLMSEAEVRAAYAVADRYGSHVLIEQYIEGFDYRLLVVNGKMVAAARRDPAMVTGDGEHTVEELVAIVNQDPRRHPGHSGSLSRIVLDDAVDLVLSQQGLQRTSIPEAGQVVKLRTNANLSTGGTAVDVTDEVHPRNIQLAELAAEIIGLDIAGIDIICHDIRRPLAEQNGAIVEVNASPGLRMHLDPAQGQARDVGAAIIEMLYPEEKNGRIPIIAVTGTNGKTTVTRLISYMYEVARWVTGMTCTEGTYIGGERTMAGDCSGPKSARAVLLHPKVEVAVLETARGGILREGLAFDWCSVGVVTNVTSDHLGIGGVNTLDELARVKQVVIENVHPDGAAVLNAEDPLVAEMAASTEGRVIYFSTDPHQHIVAAHLASGGSCVLIENGAIVLATGSTRTSLVELERVKFTAGGLIRFQVQNALAATAAAWAAGLNPAMIVRALTTFEADMATVPGRFNLREVNGVELILDYGHNVAAMRALSEAVLAFPKRRTVMVLALPGDRRDDDIVATVKQTLPFVDEYIFYDLDDRRGRAVNEVPLMMQQQIPDGVLCTIVENEQEALKYGWERVYPGDRLVAIVDKVDRSLEIAREFGMSAGEDDACSRTLPNERLNGHMHAKEATTKGGRSAKG